MKTKLFFVAVVSLSSFSALSQSLKIGVKGGSTINKISGQTFNSQFTYGYHLGGFATIGLGNKFAIQPEVLFNQVNVDTSAQFSDIYKLNKLNGVQLKYITIPLLLNYKPSKILSFQVGPQFGILMNKTKTFVENGKDAFKSGDLSMLGGIQLSVSHLRLYARYAIGLSNINDINNKDKWTSQSIQAGVGITL